MTDHSTLLAKLDLWARSHRERGLPESADLMIAARDAIVELQETIENFDGSCPECGWNPKVCPQCKATNRI